MPAATAKVTSGWIFGMRWNAAMAPATNAERPTTLPTMRSWCIFMASLNSCDAATSSSTNRAPKPTLVTMKPGERSMESGMPVETNERSSSSVGAGTTRCRPGSAGGLLGPTLDLGGLLGLTEDLATPACAVARRRALPGGTGLPTCRHRPPAEAWRGRRPPGGRTRWWWRSGHRRRRRRAQSATTSATTPTSRAATPRCRSFTRTTATSHSRRLAADTHPRLRHCHVHRITHSCIQRRIPETARSGAPSSQSRHSSGGNALHQVQSHRVWSRTRQVRAPAETGRGRRRAAGAQPRGSTAWRRS